MINTTTVNDINSLGTILFVGAHPDDETFMAGGLLAAAAHNGQQVVCVTATRGELGVQDESRWPRENLAKIREQESAEALKLLGVKEQVWLDYKDGQCQNVPVNEAVQQIATIIDKYQPNTIITFGPEGLTGHPDHKTVSAWVSKAVQGRDITVYHAVIDEDSFQSQNELDKQFNFFFNIEKPPVLPKENCSLVFELSKVLCDIKTAALKAMPSQYDQLFSSLPDNFVHTAFDCECFVRA